MSGGRALVLADRAVVRVAGGGTSRFLQGLCSQDVSGLAETSAARGAAAAAPAAFLSARGRVLCDAILVARGADEVLVDCNAGVSANLVRLLKRHRLREPLEIEDVSATHRVVAQLPARAAAGAAVQQSASVLNEHSDGDFFDDPRFAALGRRGVVPANPADVASAADSPSGDLQAYHEWRVLCGVPEGPVDFGVDTAIPLHVNMDLLNFISFSKGCYVGQELTARTKHRGAVRRRIFGAVSGLGEDVLKGLERTSPLPLSALSVAESLPGLPASGGAAGGPDEEARTLLATRPAVDGAEAGEPKACGVLHSTAGGAGLCLVRCEGQFNERENFRDQLPLPDGTSVSTRGGCLVLLRPPPYAFQE